MSKYQEWHVLEARRVRRALEKNDPSLAVMDRNGSRMTFSEMAPADFRFWGQFLMDQADTLVAIGEYSKHVASLLKEHGATSTDDLPPAEQRCRPAATSPHPPKTTDSVPVSR